MKRLMLFLIAALLFISIPVNAVAGQASTKHQFSDVKETDWFYPTVARLVEKGHIAGYTDGTFKPLNNIRVSEFTTILISALDYQISVSKDGYWAAGYINQAKEIGIIQDGEFDDYDRYITRGEMARMVVRAGTGISAKDKGISFDIPENYKEYASLITDYSILRPESQEIALKIFASGIISGFPDGSFGFNKNATRAEACAILIRFLEKGQRKVPELPEKFDLKNAIINHVGLDETKIDEDYGKHIINNSGSNVTVKLKGYTSYVYPDMGREYNLGPENTIYYAIHYDGNDEVKYGEIIRQADNFVLERVYPDGAYDEFTPTPLTEKQKQDFINKYDPAQVKKRILEEEKEMARKVDKTYSDLIEKDLVKLTKGDNYIIYTYTKPDKEAFKLISGADINYGNTVERDYDFNVESIKSNIDKILKNNEIKIHLRIYLIPYQCKDFPEGIIQYRNFNKDKSEYELRILLLNNETSMEEQFNIQFNKYLKEVKRYK